MTFAARAAIPPPARVVVAVGVDLATLWAAGLRFLKNKVEVDVLGLIR
jgi:hypothetical protein